MRLPHGAPLHPRWKQTGEKNNRASHPAFEFRLFSVEIQKVFGEVRDGKGPEITGEYSAEGNGQTFIKTRKRDPFSGDARLRPEPEPFSPFSRSPH